MTAESSGAHRAPLQKQVAKKLLRTKKNESWATQLLRVGDHPNRSNYEEVAGNKSDSRELEELVMKNRPLCFSIFLMLFPIARICGQDASAEAESEPIIVSAT